MTTSLIIEFNTTEKQKLRPGDTDSHEAER
jgi:hypothetical protein